MNQEREAEHPQNDNGQKLKGIQEEETPEEYQARWEDNHAFVTRELTAFDNLYKLGYRPHTNFEDHVNMYTRVLQEDRTRDRDKYFSFFRNPMASYSDGRRALVPGLVRRIPEKEEQLRLERERIAAKNGTGIGTNQVLEVRVMVENRQLKHDTPEAVTEESEVKEQGDQDPQARRMMENLQLEPVNEAEEIRGEEEGWVMVQ